MKSVTGNPKNCDAQSALGELCLQVGDIPRAREAFEQAVLLSPNDARNHYQLSLAYTRLGLPQKAQEHLQTYEKLKVKERNAPATIAAPPISGRPIP